jgi:hypothetical protein
VVCFDHIRFRFPPKEKFQPAARWPASTIDIAAQPFRRVAASYLVDRQGTASRLDTFPARKKLSYTRLIQNIERALLPGGRG